jgi:hypothetical protein
MSCAVSRLANFYPAVRRRILAHIRTVTRYREERAMVSSHEVARDSGQAGALGYQAGDVEAAWVSNATSVTDSAALRIAEER